MASECYMIRLQLPAVSRLMQLNTPHSLVKWRKAFLLWSALNSSSQLKMHCNASLSWSSLIGLTLSKDVSHALAKHLCLELPLQFR